MARSEMLEQKKNHLESEKKDLIILICNVLENIQFESLEETPLGGRPRYGVREVLKCLLIMSYHSWSYRRANSDLEFMKEKDMIRSIPKRSTLNKYMNDYGFKRLLEQLIELLSKCFVGVEDTLLMDSSWFFNKNIAGGSKYKKAFKTRNLEVPSHKKTRKLHIAACKKSKMIICARTSGGTIHDTTFFKEFLEVSKDLGFNIKTLLADAAYNSKDNYQICQDYGINAFLDFRKNSVLRNSKNMLRKTQLILYQQNNSVWKESYRYRVIVEGIFSSIKRKSKYVLRSRNDVSQDCEMLLKALLYNFSVISKFMDSL